MSLYRHNDLEGIWLDFCLLADAAAIMLDEEEENMITMKRIFDLIPRKKRSSFSKKRKRYEPQNPNSDTAESEKTKKKDPSNPNYNSSSTSLKRKRCTAVKEKSNRGIKKANLSPRRTITETPEWVSSVTRRMNNRDDPTLIFEKTLTSSDVKKSQGRLLISCQKLLKKDFLTHEESLAIKSDGVETNLFNQRSEKWDLCLKIWAMGNDIYALKKGWNDVVKANNLKKEDKISLWCFRCEGVLSFVLGRHTD